MLKTFELKTAAGSVINWEGETGEDAARRFVETHRDQVVIATRPADRHGVFVWGGLEIIDPGSRYYGGTA